MLKGTMDMVTQLVAALVFVAITVAIVTFAQANIIKYSADLNTVDKQVLAVDAAHMVKECFVGSSDSISDSFLQKNTLNQVNGGNYGKKICDICKICSLDVGARIEYLEGPQKGTFYDFGYNKDPLNAGLAVPQNYGHKIFVTLSDGTNNYMGSLSVLVYDTK